MEGGGICFSSGVDRKLFILSLFGKTLPEEPGLAPGAEARPVPRVEPGREAHRARVLGVWFVPGVFALLFLASRPSNPAE